jgi:hypothetical protein
MLHGALNDLRGGGLNLRRRKRIKIEDDKQSRAK